MNDFYESLQNFNPFKFVLEISSQPHRNTLTDGKFGGKFPEELLKYINSKK